MELVDIVDENNNLTGQVEERWTAYNKGMWRRTVSCWIMNYKGEILLQKRTANKRRNPNKWAKTGGQVDSGESVEEAIKREVKEETGLTLTSYQFRGLITFISDEAPEPEEMCLFTADGFTGELIECNEGDLQWMDKKEVLALPTWEGDAIFLKLLIEEDEHRFFTLRLVYEGSKLVEKQLYRYS